MKKYLKRVMSIVVVAALVFSVIRVSNATLAADDAPVTPAVVLKKTVGDLQDDGTVEVTLNVSAGVVDEAGTPAQYKTYTTDVVLLLDATNSTSAYSQNIKSAAQAYIKSLRDMNDAAKSEASLEYDAIRVSVYQFNRATTKLCGLTDISAKLDSEYVSGYTGGSGTNIKAALEAATAELANSSADNKVIVLFTDGEANYYGISWNSDEEAACKDAYDAAKAAKDAGCLIFSVHYGDMNGTAYSTGSGWNRVNVTGWDVMSQIASKNANGDPIIYQADITNLDELTATFEKVADATEGTQKPVGTAAKLSDDVPTIGSSKCKVTDIKITDKDNNVTTSDSLSNLFDNAELKNSIWTVTYTVDLGLDELNAGSYTVVFGTAELEYTDYQNEPASCTDSADDLAIEIFEINYIVGDEIVKSVKQIDNAKFALNYPVKNELFIGWKNESGELVTESEYEILDGYVGNVYAAFEEIIPEPERVGYTIVGVFNNEPYIGERDVVTEGAIVPVSPDKTIEYYFNWRTDLSKDDFNLDDPEIEVFVGEELAGGLYADGQLTVNEEGTVLVYYFSIKEAEPTVEPTKEPEVIPTSLPIITATPTPKPTAEPTAEPTPEPTAEPTPEPTAEPTEEPTPEPTEIPEIIEDIVEDETPEGTPDEDVDIEEDITPQGLPQTGFAAAGVLYGLGSACFAFGSALVIKFRKKHED